MANVKNVCLVANVNTFALGGGEWSIEVRGHNGELLKEFAGLNGTREGEEATDLWKEYYKWCQRPAKGYSDSRALTALLGNQDRVLTALLKNNDVPKEDIILWWCHGIASGSVMHSLREMLKESEILRRTRLQKYLNRRCMRRH